MRRKLAIVICGLAMIAPSALASAPRVHPLVAYSASAPTRHCPLNHHRLTLCDVRRGSARIARSGDPFTIDHCWIVYRTWTGDKAGCQIVTTWTVLLSSEPATGRFVGPTRVWLARHRICSAWVAFTGRVCF